MKILIVDDDQKRSNGLKKFVTEKCSIRNDDIYLACCLTEARDLLRTIYFDVLVLDVVLPKRLDKKNPHHSVGIGLLQEVNRSSHLKKPERIIGITAHLDDAGVFRSEFELSCNIVVEAPSNSDVWKANIASSLAYTGFSKTSRAAHLSKTAVLSVHGIRTFGQWQARLRRLIEGRVEGIAFHTYKFGYFSSLVFIFPFLRKLQVNRLQEKMAPIMNDESLDRIFIFCHSFGTYLVANALKSILRLKKPRAIITLIMCGSVLESTFDWRKVDDSSSLRIINECGNNDFVLWISAAFVFGVGMSGKVGFYGFNNKYLMNRFFKGGHSLYFSGDDFMLKQWIPLLDEPSDYSEIDERSNETFLMRAVENLVTFFAIIKPIVYFSIPFFIAHRVWIIYR